MLAPCGLETCCRCGNFGGVSFVVVVPACTTLESRHQSFTCTVGLLYGACHHRHQVKIYCFRAVHTNLSHGPTTRLLFGDAPRYPVRGLLPSEEKRRPTNVRKHSRRLHVPHPVRWYARTGERRHAAAPGSPGRRSMGGRTSLRQKFVDRWTCPPLLVCCFLPHRHKTGEYASAWCLATKYCRRERGRERERDLEMQRWRQLRCNRRRMLPAVWFVCSGMQGKTKDV